MVAQAPDAEPEPFRRKLSLGIDVSGPVMHLLQPETLSQSVSLDLELQPNLMAAFEAGMAHFRVDNPSTQYTVSGQFFRIGANYNLLQENPKLRDDQIFALLRYSFGMNTHQAPVISVENPYWGPISHSFDKLQYGAHWAEVGLGLRTRLFHHFFVGWNIRVSFMLARTGDLQVKPYYFSGFGRNTGNTKFGFQYFLYYRLPTK